MGYETLIVEREDNLGIIKLNRPPVNPLSVRSYLELYDAVCELESDAAVGAIVITGNGDKAFAAGLDVKDVMGKSAVETLDFLWTGPRKTFDKLTGVEKPTIAAVFGLALGGGCEVAICCDLRVASEDAIFGLPEINLGIMPGSEAPKAGRGGEGKRDAAHGRQHKRPGGLSHRSCKQSGPKRETDGRSEGAGPEAGIEAEGRPCAYKEMRG